MATQLTNYQCPACTGPLHFDGASGKLVCDFCGSSYDTAEIEALYAEEAAAETAAQNKQAPPPDSVWSENEAAGLRSYSCPSCGAELICDDDRRDKLPVLRQPNGHCGAVQRYAAA